MVKVLKTDNGPHSAEKWALTTAETIFDIGDTVTDDRLIQAKKLQTSLAEVLFLHHNKIQIQERQKLRTDVSHINTPHSAEEYMQDVMEGVVSVSKNTPWEKHFARIDVQTAIKETVKQHLMSSQHVERLWHADRNPDCKVSQSYKQRYHS